MKDEPDWVKRMRGKSRNLKGKRAERRVAKKFGGRRVGGSGNTDVVKGRARIEVKHRKSKVTKPELRAFRKKHGTTQVVSKAGYTDPAIRYAKKRGMKLHKGTHIIRPVTHKKKKKWW